MAEIPGPGEMEIAGDEAHHIVRVKRLHVGEEIVIFDGSGQEAEAEIIEASVETGVVRVRIKNIRESDKEASVAITLASAVPKGKRAEFMIQKCAELGVRRFIPLDCARSAVNIRTRAENKIQKWQRICAEASKQSGRNRITEIACPHTVDEALRLVSSHRLALIATLGENTSSLRSVLAATTRMDSILYLVGPEGGFTRAEVTAATRAGCKPVALAPSVLRTETAAIAGVAMLIYATSHQEVV